MKNEPTEVSYFSALVLSITEVDVRRLTWLMIGVFFLVQGVLREVKVLYYGENFVHWVDVLAVLVLTCFYIFYAKLIGEMYVDEYSTEEDNIPLNLGGEEPDSDQAISISANVQGIEELVVGLYKEADVSPEEVIASLTSVVGACVLATGSNSVRVARSGMEIAVFVKDTFQEQ